MIILVLEQENGLFWSLILSMSNTS